MRIGDVFRYPRPRQPDRPIVDGAPNFFHVVYTPGRRLPQLERGISGIAPIVVGEVERRPAILIRSSPHRVGSELTPWQDLFDVDAGHISYYGDRKATNPKSPELVAGNRLLLSEFALHKSSSPLDRGRATPVLFFRGTAVDGANKGYVEFQGLGILEGAELVTQQDPRSLRSFTNYRFEFLVMSLSAEDEAFDWKWVNLRGDSTVSAAQCLSAAPVAWRRWVNEGDACREMVRRHVLRLRTVSKAEQLPAPGSKQEHILNAILTFYAKKKHRFEGLAERVSAEVLKSSHADYRLGWITPQVADHGADFVARLDVGEGFGKAPLVVLGQAKCESPDRPTSGRDVARTVARLRRGWLGVYVTTSFFSTANQEEILEDEYPVVLINGRKVAETVSRIMVRDGHRDVRSLLESVDKDYEGRVRARRPSEILVD